MTPAYCRIFYTDGQHVNIKTGHAPEPSCVCTSAGANGSSSTLENTLDLCCLEEGEGQMWKNEFSQGPVGFSFILTFISPQNTEVNSKNHAKNNIFFFLDKILSNEKY